MLASTTITVIRAVYSTFESAITLDGFIHMILVAIGAIILTVLFSIFFLRKEIRLFMNRRRPIKIFRADGFDMDAEVSLLRKSKLFNIEEPTTDTRSASEIGNHSLVIVGYTPKMPGFANILDAVKAAKVPVIVYTRDRMDGEDETALKAYPWYSVCNFPLKLSNDVFTILSTFPKMK